MNYPPPPTRFGPAAAQAKVTISAGLGRAAPPPTKFGPAAAQAKATGSAGPGQALPVPKFGAPPPVARLFRTRSAVAEAPSQGPWMQTIQPSRTKKAKDPAAKFFKNYQNKSEFDTSNSKSSTATCFVGWWVEGSCGWGASFMAGAPLGWRWLRGGRPNWRRRYRL